MAPKERDRPSSPTGTDCALHGQRIDQLEDGLDSLRGEQRQTHDAVADLRTEIALLRQAIEAGTKATEQLREDQRKARERGELPNKAQVMTVLLAALLAVFGSWIGSHLPAAQAHQPSPPGAHS